MAKRENISRLLVGVANPETMPRLIDLAVRLRRVTGCEIIATHVVAVPGQIGLGSARSSPEVVAGRRLLQDVLDMAQAGGVGAEAVVEVGREVHEGLVAAARSRHADLVLVGYSEERGEHDEGSERRFDRVMHRVERELDASLLVGKFRGEAAGKILVPVDTASTFSLIAPVIEALTLERAASVRFLHVTPTHESPETAPAVLQRITESGLDGLGDLETVRSDDIGATVLAHARAYDLVLLEAGSTLPTSDGLLGVEAETIAGRAACSTLLLRARAKV